MSLTLPELPSVYAISTRVIRLLGFNPSPMTLQGTNSYLIGSGSHRLLIDTTYEDMPQYVNSLKHVLKETGAIISNILLTHWHQDHVGSVNAIKALCQQLGQPEPTIHKLFPSYKLQVSAHALTDGQHFTVRGSKPGEDTSLVIIATPGHTEDHVCIFLPEEKFLFSGDLILGHGSTTVEKLGPYLQSLEKVKKYSRKEEVNAILPAHGEVIREPMSKIAEYIEHRLSRINQVKSLLNVEWKSEQTLLDLVYPELENYLVPAALNNLRQALELLLNEKIAESRSMPETSISEKEWRLKKAKL